MCEEKSTIEEYTTFYRKRKRKREGNKDLESKYKLNGKVNLATILSQLDLTVERYALSFLPSCVLRPDEKIPRNKYLQKNVHHMHIQNN